MSRLADHYTLIAPELRGFGDSEKPAGALVRTYTPPTCWRFSMRLVSKSGGHRSRYLGGATMQPMARKAPERIAGLFFFDCVYPGIGARKGTPDRLNEIWYQSFHQTEMAPALVGATRETCRLYIEYFLRHWSHRKAAFDDVLDAFVDNFLKPGNLAGGFAHYRDAHAGRIAIMKGEAPPLPKISVKTCVRWGKHDPILLSQWTDKLARRSRISISRFFPMSVTSRIAKILIEPRRRSPVSSSASAG